MPRLYRNVPYNLFLAYVLFRVCRQGQTAVAVSASCFPQLTAAVSHLDKHARSVRVFQLSRESQGIHVHIHKILYKNKFQE